MKNLIKEIEVIDEKEIPVTHDHEHTVRLFAKFVSLEKGKALKLDIKEYSNCTCRYSVKLFNAQHPEKLLAVKQAMPFMYVYVK